MTPNLKKKSTLKKPGPDFSKSSKTLHFLYRKIPGKFSKKMPLKTYSAKKYISKHIINGDFEI